MTVPSRRVVRDELNNLLSYLVESEIALLANAVRDEGERISWHRFNASATFLEFRDPPTFDGYRNWVANGEYSALLYDGSLLQVSYDFAGALLISHRLVWVPCPFDVDPDLLQLEPLLDVLDLYAQADRAMSCFEALFGSTLTMLELDRSTRPRI